MKQTIHPGSFQQLATTKPAATSITTNLKQQQQQKQPKRVRRRRNLQQKHQLSFASSSFSFEVPLLFVFSSVTRYIRFFTSIRMLFTLIVIVRRSSSALSTISGTCRKPLMTPWSSLHYSSSRERMVVQQHHHPAAAASALSMALDSRELRLYGTSSSTSSSSSSILEEAFRLASFHNPSSILIGTGFSPSSFTASDLSATKPTTLAAGAVAAAALPTTTKTATTSKGRGRPESNATISTSNSSREKSRSSTLFNSAATVSSSVLSSSSFTTTVTATRYYQRSYTSTTTKDTKNEHTIAALKQNAASAAAAAVAASFSARKKSSSSQQSDSAMPSASPSEPKASTQQQQQRPPKEGYGQSIHLSDEEKSLFNLLRQVRTETHLETTLRVAGGWVRDKLLATPEFKAYHTVFNVGLYGAANNNNKDGGNGRLTSKFRRSASSANQLQQPSMGRQGTKVLVKSDQRISDHDMQPVDIDIALDDMLGREFADHLNDYLTLHGEDTVSVGVVLKNPEKSKHLETATMKVGPFWIDFVNLRAEEYTQDSRIPELMRIGTAAEDAFRRDLTINALFYNVNTGQIEDWTGRGFDDLRKGVVATPLPPLTTLLDDPLRVLRSIRFAARLRFTMDEDLINAARNPQVRNALRLKVSRERVGGEVDLMLRSPDPVGAVRLLINLQLVGTVFPIQKYLSPLATSTTAARSPEEQDGGAGGSDGMDPTAIFNKGLTLLSTCHDHLADCRLSPPLWCSTKSTMYGTVETRLTEDEEGRRLLWYASFLKPFHDHVRKEEASKKQLSQRQASRKSNRSAVLKLLVDDMKRPTRDSETVERIMKAADDITHLLRSGCDVSATMMLLSDVSVANDHFCGVNGKYCEDQKVVCSMNGRIVDSVTEEDPVWEHAMEFRLLCSEVLKRIGPHWRAAMVLSLAEQLASLEDDDENLEYTIEGDTFDESQEEKRQGIVERYDIFGTAMQRLGLIGIWNEKPLLNGGEVKKLLPNVPGGPPFRDVMMEQTRWMVSHPGANAEALGMYLQTQFPDFC